MAINETKLNEFIGKAVGDIGAGMSAALIVIGDKLGLYKAMSGAGPLSSSELAKRTGLNERYVREWLGNQAAGGYVSYDAVSGKYTLPEEQAFCLTNEYGNVFFPGAFQIVLAAQLATPRITKAFKTGEGIAWGDQDPSLFEGTERFFRPSYIGNLIGAWIPALNEMDARLKQGAKVADVGCGLGASTIIMAKAYPKSQFLGFDYHKGSIDLARERLKETNLKNVTFEVGGAGDYPGHDYDLVTYFDCLHDMADPVGAAKRVKKSLKNDGSWMIVEPFANDKVEDNLNPVGRVYYGASTLLCVPSSLAGNGPALGAQAGEARLREVVVDKGGFKSFRRATQTPFNLVFEAKP